VDVWILIEGGVVVTHHGFWAAKALNGVSVRNKRARKIYFINFTS
jgi:hypothetical protein